MKGRGALSNPANRFHEIVHEPVASEVDDAPALDTRVEMAPAKSLISVNRSPDVPFDLSVNPYRGCEHGCIYCYARPSHAFLDLSPGLDFETRIFAKPNAAAILEQELSRPGYRCGVIALAGNTDAYQPTEKRLAITRELLGVMHRFRQPVSVITKSALVLRDLDLLTAMADEQLVSVTLSVTSLDPAIKRTLEPRTASPAARLKTIAALAAAGIPTGVLVAPVIPKITDHELEAILRVAAEAGAQQAGYILIRLPLEVRDLFVAWLEQHYPQRAAAVMSLIRQCHDGRDYRSGYGVRMKGTGHFADLIERRFRAAARRYGLDRKRSPPLDTSRFRVPLKSGGQLSLF